MRAHFHHDRPRLYGTDRGTDTLDQSGDLLTSKVVDGQIDVLCLRQGKANHRAAVEGIGEILLQADVRWRRVVIVFQHGRGFRRGRRLLGDQADITQV